MAVEVIFYYVHRCATQHMFSFSHILKRRTGPYLLTPHMDVRLFNVMNTASATPAVAIPALHAPELQLKSVYDTRHE